MDIHSITISILALVILFQEFRLYALNRKFAKLLLAFQSLNEANGHLADAVKQTLEHIQQQDNAISGLFHNFLNLIDAINKAKEAIQKELNNE